MGKSLYTIVPVKMLNNGTSLAISLAKMDVQLDMQEMGIDDRDDIGDDEVGDDD